MKYYKDYLDFIEKMISEDFEIEDFDGHCFYDELSNTQKDFVKDIFNDKTSQNIKYIIKRETNKFNDIIYKELCSLKETTHLTNELIRQINNYLKFGMTPQEVEQKIKYVVQNLAKTLHGLISNLINNFMNVMEGKEQVFFYSLPPKHNEQPGMKIKMTLDKLDNTGIICRGE